MGTKKLNEVEKVTTMNTNDCVPLVLADGSIGQILKTDLVNALANVFPAITASHVARHSSSSVSDLNEIWRDKDPGLYVNMMASSTLNRPTSVTTGAVVTVIRSPKNNVSTSQVIVQIANDASDIAYRTGVGNGTDITWKEWVDLPNGTFNKYFTASSSTYPVKLWTSGERTSYISTSILLSVGGTTTRQNLYFISIRKSNTAASTPAVNVKVIAGTYTIPIIYTKNSETGEVCLYVPVNSGTKAMHIEVLTRYPEGTIIGAASEDDLTNALEATLD